MTTHHPYGVHAPHQHPGPPPGMLPPGELPPVYGAVTPYELPLPQHGGYLVTYPERLTDARPTVPPVWPVAVFTLLFGVFGAVPAGRRATRAKAAGGGAAAYWLTFGLIHGVMVAVLVLLAVAVGVPAYVAAREGAIVKVLQESVVSTARAADTTPAVIGADCRAEGERAADGLRPYRCVLTLADGRTSTMHVRADEDGRWVPAPTA